MKASDHGVLPHHQRAAAMWGRGGKAYDEVSFAISDALAHAAQRLNACAGEHILDVATGTGWSARNVSRRGAMVTGVDISPELLAAAADLSGQVGVQRKTPPRQGLERTAVAPVERQEPA